MRQQFAHIVFVAVALMSAALTQRAFGLGLDDIEVSSNLNQRFSASIRLTEVSAEDLETVTADVAPNEAFERAGIERAEYLSSLDFQIKNDHGQPRVLITSSQIVREPVLNLLVQASWRGGKILRDYSVLLDPAETIAVGSQPAPAVSDATAVAAQVPIASSLVSERKQNSKVEPAPIIAKPETFYQPLKERLQDSASKPANATEKPVVSAYVVPTADATGRYGPVIAKETLWSIATKVRPDGVSMDQVLFALSEANPGAIQHGTTVNKGAMLKVPSAKQMQSITVLEAMKRLDHLRSLQAHLPAQAMAKPAIAQTQTTGDTKPEASSSAVTPIALQANATLGGRQPAIIAEASKVASSDPQPEALAVAAAATVKPDQPAAVTNPVAPSSAEMPVESLPPAAPIAPATAVAATAAPSLSQRLPEPASNTDEPPDFLLLALIVGLLLLAAGIFVLARRRGKTNVSNQAFAEFTAKSPASDTSSDNAARFAATQTLTERAMKASDATQQITQQIRQQQTQKAAPQEHDFGATLVLEPQVMASLKESAKASVVDDGKTADFDKTMQVDVDTLQIDLNDNDPLAEADFHLAYGLYDEAIQLLQTAVKQSPSRLELEAKLVETYFAAGRAIEFQELAANLRDKLTPAEWSKVVIMGSQICPDAALFQTGTDERLVPETDFDLAFDDALPPKAEPSLQVSSVGDARLEFSVSSPALSAQPETGTRDAESSLSFMLEEMSNPAPIDMPEPVDKNIVEFALGSPSLDISIPKLSEPEPRKSDSKSGSSLEMDSLGFDLQEFEFSLTSSSLSSDPVSNDFNTKLDLARAYVEMGDNDMARSLLHEVQLQGNANQQQEATSLLQRLPK